MNQYEIEQSYETILQDYLYCNQFGEPCFREATQVVYSEPIPVECREYGIVQENTPNHTCRAVDDFLLRINNAGIIKFGRTPVLVDHTNKKVLCHSSLDLLYCFEAAHWENLLRQIKFNSVVQLKGRALLIDTLFGNEFYHFNISSLSKLAKYLNFNQFLDSIDYFIFPENNSFIIKWKEVLGIDEKRIIHLENQQHLVVEELIVPSNDCLISSQTIAFLRNSLLRSKVIPGDKLFVSRKRSLNGRQLLNEQHLFDKYLSPKGFKYIELETFGLRDQARIIASATHIIAPHGAGLTNLVFCSPEAKVLELFGSNWVVKCYAQCASLLGIKACYHVSEELEGNNYRIGEQTFNNIVQAFID